MDSAVNWEVLERPVPPEEIRWRADGRPKNGRVRAVAYTDSEYVRRVLDEATGGRWTMTLSPFGTIEVIDKATGLVKGRLFYVSCSLVVGGLVREDVGQGKDPKEAASDSLKRAAHRFGVAAELWRYPATWASCDDYGNLTEVPRVVAGSPPPAPRVAGSPPPVNGRRETPPPTKPLADVPACPRCGGSMWDNRRDKRNAKAPDFKCKDKSCVDEKGFVTGVWEEEGKAPAPTPRRESKALVPSLEDPPSGLDEDDELPF